MLASEKGAIEDQGASRALRYKGVVYGQYRRSREGRGLIDTGIGKVSDLVALIVIAGGFVYCPLNNGLVDSSGAS